MKRGNKRKFAIAVGVISTILALHYWLYPLTTTHAPKIDSGQNAIWLSGDWAKGDAPETANHLGERLNREGIRDAYFLVRYIGQSGRLRFRDQKKLRQLNREVKKDAPRLRRFAWVYIGNQRGITGVDIARPEIRSRIAAEMRFLTSDCGFDGVQVDYEICSDGDSDFLKLLAEIRAQTSGKLLCVATPMWLPSPLGAYGWSEDYFSEVATKCDQIAVMSYDSALYFPRHYVWLVAQQTVRVPRAASNGNTRCRVLIGVPTYEKGGASHWPYAENLRLGLRGVREGAEAVGVRPSFQGAAIFADYTTDAGEWRTWERDWRVATTH